MISNIFSLNFTLSLDMEPNTAVHVVTDLMLKENLQETLFDDNLNFKTIVVPKNIRKVSRIINEK